MVRLFSIPFVECCSAWRLVITLLACAGLTACQQSSAPQASRAVSFFVLFQSNTFQLAFTPNK